MADETRTIRIIVDASKAVEGSAAATAALAKMERAQAATVTALDRIEQALGRVGGYMKAQLTMMVADVASRLVSMATNALNAAANMEELAEQVGLTATGLQAMQFAAVQNNVKLEQLEGGLGKFAQKMGEAAEGSKEMIEALDRLGVKNLDAAGKLRPTEKLMQEVAASILKIEDPARRAAAMVDFFGKTGAKMLPMLKEIAGGFDDMAAKAKAGGAMISAEAIAKLDKLADSSERSQLKMRALFAENAADPLTQAIDFITRKMENLAAIVKGVSLDIGSLLKVGAYIANPGLLTAQIFAKTPAEKLASDLEDARKRSAQAWDDLGSNKTTDRERPMIMSAYAKAQEQIATLERQQSVMTVGGPANSRLPSDPDGIGIVVGSKGGAKLSAIKGAGQSEADAIAKLRRDTARELADALDQAGASEKGARAVADLESHYKALKAAQDAYGKTADQNAGQVAALTSEIEKQIQATERAKNLKDFNLGTEELEKANTLMEAENRLINANAEDRAREIALIRLKQDVQSKGLDENNAKEREAIDRRAAAIGQNERLKAQGEELKKANELWTEPLKTALNSIQTTAADAFATMLESGKFSFQALGDVVKKTVIRMIAEFAALATIRPLLGSLMGGLVGVGLASPATAANLGYGGGMGGSSVSMPGGGFTGGLSGMTMPSWLGGGQPFGFLGNPIFPNAGPSAGSSPAMTMGAQYGATSSGLGGVTWGQGIGAAAGIGMGAYQLATANGNTGKTIAGVGSMIGAGVSLIPGMQPVGMAISLLSQFAPSLFGDDKPKLPPLAGASINFNPGAGGYTTSNSSQNGGASLQGQFGGVADTINALYAATGGKVNYGLATGGAIWNNQREGTTSTYAIHPTLGSVQLSEGSGDQSAAIDRMIAKMFYMTATTPGAISGMSSTLTTALGNKEPTSTAAVQNLLAMVKTYDQLGKVLPTAKDALDEIAKKFTDLTNTATEYGLALAPIQAEQKKVTTRYAQDFIDGMLNPLAAQMRALDDQAKESIASAEYIRDNVSDVYVDIQRITDYWTQKKLDAEAQYYQQSVGNLQTLIRRLTYGDLANASPDTSLSGTRGTYSAALAQARAGSGTALANLSGYAEAYANAGRASFASGPEYAAIVAQLRADLTEIAGTTGGGTGTGAAANQATNALLQTVSEQSGQVAALVAALAQVKDELAEATAQLKRRA